MVFVTFLGGVSDLIGPSTHYISHRIDRVLSLHQMARVDNECCAGLARSFVWCTLYFTSKRKLICKDTNLEYRIIKASILSL